MGAMVATDLLSYSRVQALSMFLLFEIDFSQFFFVHELSLDIVPYGTLKYASASHCFTLYLCY
jgi:hypothetical protein